MRSRFDAIKWAVLDWWRVDVLWALGNFLDHHLLKPPAPPDIAQCDLNTIFEACLEGRKQVERETGFGCQSEQWFSVMHHEGWIFEIELILTLADEVPGADLIGYVGDWRRVRVHRRVRAWHPPNVWRHKLIQ